MISSGMHNINHIKSTELVPDAFNQGTVAIITSAQESSNLDMTGPYVKLTWALS